MKKRLVLLFAFVLPLLVPPPAHAQANLRSDVAAVRAKYPTPMSPAQQAAVVNEVAWKHRAEGWGVYGKPDGNNCPQPKTGTKISCDFLIFRPAAVGFDVLRASEGAGEPTWNGPQAIDVSRFVAPVEPDGFEPPPPPPADDFVTRAELRAAVDALSARLAKLEAGSGSGSGDGDTPPADDVAREQLRVTKEILELLKKAAARLGIQ